MPVHYSEILHVQYDPLLCLNKFNFVFRTSFFRLDIFFCLISSVSTLKGLKSVKHSILQVRHKTFGKKFKRTTNEINKKIEDRRHTMTDTFEYNVK